MWVKICGVTNEEDALLAAALGADAVGFIFAPSKRQIDASTVHDIVRRLPTEILTVGVFRNEAPKRVIQLMNQAGLKAAQLHGNESVDDAAYVAKRVPAVIKVFASNAIDYERIARYSVDAVMIDAPSGGSGEVIDWAALDPDALPPRWILAGGLNAANVADAIKVLRPWGIDAASGTEASPGRKDPVALREFIANAKAAGRELRRTAS